MHCKEWVAGGAPPVALGFNFISQDTYLKEVERTPEGREALHVLPRNQRPPPHIPLGSYLVHTELVSSMKCAALVIAGCVCDTFATVAMVLAGN
eukprot:6462015-Amphidinium_carterae.1